jgi:hypothetical protein
LVEFDVTSAITGDGIYGFGMSNRSTSAVKYSSKEGANPPELMIITTTSSSSDPVISAFTPGSGSVGTEVTITGINFASATKVTFNGNEVTSFTVDSGTRIRAVVPVGATTGKISVTNAAGTGTSTGDFAVTTGGSITLTFHPTDDAYVRSSRPTDSYGNASELRMEKTSSAEIYTFLKFNVSGLSGAVQSAKVRLYVTNGSNDGGVIYTVSGNYLGTSTPWLESGLRWNNAPAISPDGSGLSSAGFASVGQTIEFDVTSAITGDGIFSFGLKNGSSDMVRYSSKEGTNLPELIIQAASGSASAAKTASPRPDSIAISNDHIATLLPEHSALFNYPNPLRFDHLGFNGETRIVYQLPRRSHVRLALYDLLGRELKILLNKEQEAGIHEVSWDGRDARDNLLPSGTYIYRIQAGSFRSSKKLLLVR